MVPSHPKTNPPIPSSTQPLTPQPHPASTAQVTNPARGGSHRAKTQGGRHSNATESRGGATPPPCTHQPRAAFAAPGTPSREGRGKNKTHTNVFFFQAGPEESRLAAGTDNSPSPARRARRFPARLGMSFRGRFQVFPPGVPSHIKEWMASSAMPGQGWPGTVEANGPGWRKFTGLPSSPRDAEHPVMAGYSPGRRKQAAAGDAGSAIPSHGWRRTPARWLHTAGETGQKV